ARGQCWSPDVHPIAGDRMDDDAEVLARDTNEDDTSLATAIAAAAMLVLGLTIALVWPEREGVTPSGAALIADFGLIVAYAAFLIGTASTASRHRFGERAIGIAIIAATAMAAIADIAENLYGLTFANGFSLPVATAATGLKWGYFFAAVLFAGVLTAFRDARPRRIGGALLLIAAMLGFAGSFTGSRAIQNGAALLVTLGALVAAVLPRIVARIRDRVPPGD